jgi:hypothetical protein
VLSLKPKIIGLCGMLALAGCNSESGDFKKVSDKDTKETPAVIDDHDHDHGPHGGHVIELGEHHGEIALEADRKLTLYVLDGDVKNAVPLADATALANLKIGTEMQKIELKALPQDGEADGKSSRFQSAEPLPESVKDIEDLTGDVTLTVAGKGTTGPIEHHHH